MNNPVGMKKFHGWMTVGWAVMMPVSILTGWVNLVVYVSVLSIYALFIGHFSSWQAARVEVRQEEIEGAKDLDVEKRIEGKVEEVAENIKAIVPEETAIKTVEKLNGH